LRGRFFGFWREGGRGGEGKGFLEGFGEWGSAEEERFFGKPPSSRSHAGRAGELLVLSVRPPAQRRKKAGLPATENSAAAPGPRENLCPEQKSGKAGQLAEEGDSCSPVPPLSCRKGTRNSKTVSRKIVRPLEGERFLPSEKKKDIK